MRFSKTLSIEVGVKQRELMTVTKRVPERLFSAPMKNADFELEPIVFVSMTFYSKRAVISSGAPRGSMRSGIC